MGFSLDEIKKLFSTGGANQCQMVRELLLEKLDELESKIEQMRNFKVILNRHLANCENELKTHGNKAACRVLVTIEKVKQ